MQERDLLDAHSTLRWPLHARVRRLGRWMKVHPPQVLGLIIIMMLMLGGIRLWFDPPSYESGQTEYWWSVAVNLIEDRGYVSCSPQYFPFCGPTNNVTAMREPAPVVLFTVVAFLSQRSFWAAAGVELVLNIGILLALYGLVREWANVRAAVLAALLWALYVPALTLVPHVSGDLLATLMTTLALWLFLRAQKTGRARYWLAAGMSLGLGVLSRSALLVVAVPLILGLLLKLRPTWTGVLKAVRPVVLFGLALSLTIAPWLVRNALAFGQPVLGTTLTGYNLYRHNFMLGTDNYLRYVGAHEARQAIDALIAERPDLRGTETEAQMDNLYRAEALRVIRDYPLRYVALSLYRFLPLWFNWEVPEAYGLHSSALDYLMMAQQALLLMLAVVGLRRVGWRRAWPFLASVLIFSLAYMAVNGQLRYLVPVMPLLVSLSAVGSLSLWQRWSGNTR